MLLSDLIGKMSDKCVCGGVVSNGGADNDIYANTDITDIQIDSRLCKAGSLFICVQGYLRDGNRFAAAAVRQGAAAIITGDIDALKRAANEMGAAVTDEGFFAVDGAAAPIAIVDNVRLAVAVCADTLYDHPSGSLDLIGITGTKGKTTTAYMIRNILAQDSQESGMIGTICNYIGNERVETERTTPEANVLQELLARMRDANIGKCVMEVSSQGLHLDRVGCCEYSTALFTNLSRDHIGDNEHSSMEDYASAKAKLFSMTKRALINADNEWSDFMLDKAYEYGTKEIYTYGIEGDAHFTARNVRTMPEHVEYDVYVKGERTAAVRVPIPGRFTVYNSLASFACAYLEGVAPDVIVKGLSSVFVPGKAEIVPTGRDFTVMIDYAHNPDSFINILTTVREYAKRTVFVFGCGGDRNRPRALMGETAGKYADFTIITSDNPRSEDPVSIVHDLEAGIKTTGAPYICIVDRSEAIKYAIRNARSGDVIILAGKGHETYQILKDRTIHFDEREVVRDVLAEMAAEEDEK